jgi:hypothetical protein
MITISKTGHEISKDNIIKAVKWDIIKDGFCGNVQYELSGNEYLNPVTISELDAIAQVGVKIDYIKTRYGGTY